MLLELRPISHTCIMHSLLFLPQALTSCDDVSTTCGCSSNPGCGGSPQLAFSYIISNKGLASANTYPFVGYQALQAPTYTSQCNAALTAAVSVDISNYCTMPQSLSAMQSALAYQVGGTSGGGGAHYT